MLQEAAVEAGDAFEAGILADLGDAALGLQKQQPGLMQGAAHGIIVGAGVQHPAEGPLKA